jgi:hypothetical protein
MLVMPVPSGGRHPRLSRPVKPPKEKIARPAKPGPKEKPGPKLCACGCGEPIPPGSSKWATGKCRRKAHTETYFSLHREEHNKGRREKRREKQEGIKHEKKIDRYVERMKAVLMIEGI